MLLTIISILLSFSLILSGFTVVFAEEISETSTEETTEITTEESTDNQPDDTVTEPDISKPSEKADGEVIGKIYLCS